MPIYDMFCKNCTDIVEIMCSYSDLSNVKCEECSSYREQKLQGTAPGLVFKGDGWIDKEIKREARSKKKKKGKED